MAVVGEDQSADVLGDLRHDGVSAGRNQLGGKPINHSIRATGGLHPCVRTAPSMFAIARRPYRGLPALAPLLGHPWRPKLATGVGHKEQSLPCVWCTHGARG